MNKGNPTEQNELLHAHMMLTCTKESMMVVCDILIGVEGNPRMKALGENMKSMLECQCCVFYTLICISVCVCVTA